MCTLAFFAASCLYICTYVDDEGWISFAISPPILPGSQDLAVGELHHLQSLFVWTVSSTNNLVSLAVQSGKWLMNARNYSGPSTVPWGTPDTMSACEETTPSSRTRCFLWLINYSFQGRVSPGTQANFTDIFGLLFTGQPTILPPIQ